MSTPYRIRMNYDNFVPKEDYGDDCTHFSIKIHHGGKFSRFPGRKYVKGQVSWVDLVDGDHFSVHELNGMIVKLGYGSGDEVIFSHYKIPGTDLDVGLRTLANDSDVINMLKYVERHKIIEVYLEHTDYTVDTYFKSPDGYKVVIEDIVDDVDKEPVKKKATKTPACNKALFIEWPAHLVNEFDPFFGLDFPDGEHVTTQTQEQDHQLQHDDYQNGGNEHLTEHVTTQTDGGGLDAEHTTQTDGGGLDAEHTTQTDEVQDQQHHHDYEHDEDPNDAEHVTTQTEQLEHDDYLDSGSEESDSEDGDYFVDEENLLENVDVDMRNFIDSIDLNEEWLADDEQQEQHDEDPNDAEASIDVDDFESASDEENDTAKKKMLRKLRREKKMSLEESVDKQSVLFYVGQVFSKKEIVKEMISVHALETRRQLHILRNDKVRFRVICKGLIPSFEKEVNAKEVGGSKDNVVGGSNIDKGILDSTINTNEKESCPWVLYVSKTKDAETWTVKTYIDVHTCLPTRDVKQCTATFLAKEVQDTILPNPKIPIKALQDQIQRKYEVHVSEMKIFRAKVMASKSIQGDFSFQYALLRDYALELIRSNEGTTVKIETEPCANPTTETRVFRRIYICLGPLKKGFASGMRPLLGLDGSFMKGPWPGQILTAVGIDGNNGIYPLAYAIVEAENKASWTWFLECLGDDLDLDSRSNYTFISDRQKGILPALSKTFPSAEHRFCLRHIAENMKLKWKGNLYKDQLFGAATTTTVPDFKEKMDKLKKFDKSAYDWLAKIPPRHWSRIHFSGRSKCDVVLNNLCEVFNKQLVDGRDKPIITCLEFIREYIMRKIVNVQKVIDKSEGPLTPTATKVFKKIKSDAAKCKVSWNALHKFQVSDHAEQYVVDVQQKSCSCRKWKLTGIPCKHVVASFWNMSVNGQEVGLPESWVDRSYWLQTWKQIYMHKIDPINGRKLWPKSPAPTTILPPKHHTPIGRPKKKRRKSADELNESVNQGGKMPRLGGSVTCAKCNKQGHNSRTCKGQEPAKSKKSTVKGKRPVKQTAKKSTSTPSTTKKSTSKPSTVKKSTGRKKA